MSDSRLKYFDRKVPIHRAIHNFNFPRSRLLGVLFLPLAFTLLMWPALKIISAFWGHVFDFWIAKIGIVGSVVFRMYGPEWLDLSMPYLDVSASSPEASVWWGMLFVVVLAIAASLLIPDRYTPLRYFVRICALIQLSSLAYFVLSPGIFPYTLQNHLMGLETTAISLMIILPWIHALIYYIFDYSLIKKLFFSWITLAVCTLIVPFMLMLHAYLMYMYSLMLMPLLYFIFGILPLIMVCISLYGWAMSWVQRDSS